MAGDTRERILDVAERLFAAPGFVSTSLRDITAEAGVNLAAVNYHFGSKEALLIAILERRIRPFNQRRLALLDELEARHPQRGPTPEQILAAFVGPVFQSAAATDVARRRELLKLVGQLHSLADPDIRKLFFRQFDEVRIRFTTSLQRALPHVAPEEVARRVMYVVGAMTYIMSWGEDSGWPPSHAPERLLQSLVDFASAGLAADESQPQPAETPVAAPQPAAAPLSAQGGRA